MILRTGIEGAVMVCNQNTPPPMSERASARVLTRSHWDALAELASYEGKNRLYWWREASMKVLIEHGFAEQYCPPSVAERPRMKCRPYRITAAGRDALAGGSSHV